MTRVVPMPGQIYRHFKNNLYQILSVAEHTETKEMLVIYQSLYGNFKVYARPLTMFLSEVDKEKYPDVPQQYRFELVNGMGICGMDEALRNETNADGSYTTDPDVMETPAATIHNNAAAAEADEDMEGAVNPLLLKFLDTDSYAEKLEVLEEIRNQLDNRLIDDIATVIDVVIEEGPIKARYESLKACIETMMKYECGRLR